MFCKMDRFSGVPLSIGTGFQIFCSSYVGLFLVYVENFFQYFLRLSCQIVGLGRALFIFYFVKNVMF